MTLSEGTVSYNPVMMTCKDADIWACARCRRLYKAIALAELGLVHQYIPENLIILSTALDGEEDALEVIPVAFVH